MLKREPFEKKEFETIRQARLHSYNYIGIFLKFFVPLSFAFAFSGLIFHHTYWHTLLFLLSGFLITAIYLTIKPRYLLYKDLKERIKYIGTVTVTKKADTNKGMKIYFPSGEIKRLDIPLKRIYDEIEIGDDLYLEIAKNSRLIFKLKKDHTLLFKSV